MIHAKYSEKVPLMTSANESAVLETLYPQKKMETTLMHAKNLEKLHVETSEKISAVLRPFYPSRKKGDDGNTR